MSEEQIAALLSLVPFVKMWICIHVAFMLVGTHDVRIKK